MELLYALLHGAAYAALALALPLPSLRRPAMLVVALAAITSIAGGLFGPAEHTLTTIHTFAGYEGDNQELSMRPFPTGTVQAPGWAWPLPFAAFAGLWLVLLARLGKSLPKRSWLLPLLLAWTATAQWLGMQALAAPAATVQPLGIDRVLFPAGVALAVLVASRAKTVAQLLFAISAGTLAARLPAALFSKVASDLRLGTCLDITAVGSSRAVGNIVNPMTGLQIEDLVAGSSMQQFWLIWLEHVIIFPALYLLSLVGISFGIYMYHRQAAATDEALGSAAPAGRTR